MLRLLAMQFLSNLRSLQLAPYTDVHKPANLYSSFPHETPPQALSIPKASNEICKKSEGKKGVASGPKSAPYKNNLVALSLLQKARTMKSTIQK